MSDWFVGQKIVCVNVEPLDGGVLEPEVTKHLKVGKVYVIREILDFPFTHKDQRDIRLAFRLGGIKCVSRLTHGKLWEYAFWEGRFQPLQDDPLEIGVPEQMKDWLKVT